MSFSDMPVDVGPVYEGERIRAKQMYVELGGPKMDKHFELVRVKPAKEIKDGEVTLHGLDLKDMEINIGVVTPLTSPYNLFLNVKQISDPESELVYFYVYSFGKKKVILWGVYVKNTEEFIIEGGCKYAVKNLNKYLKEWKKRDYSYIVAYTIGLIPLYQKS